MPEGGAARLVQWIEAVASWNRKVDLTAARSDEELVDLMVADAAILARHIAEGLHVVDVGSGAGAPGLPLSMLRPDLRVTLVEPMDKRVAFLRRSVGLDAPLRPASSPAPKVVRGRGEALVGASPFDAAISRATLDPNDWLALGHELAPAGPVWVLLARGEPPLHPARRLDADVGYNWPLTGAARRAVSYLPRGG